MKLAQTPIALKEWAVTVDTLLQGDLIFVMRKGGIIEETKDFQLRSPEFYLMPAYEHQKEHLLKEAYQGRIANTLSGWSPNQSYMELKGYASVVEDIQITTEEQLNDIAHLHIWTDQFAEERLKWKKKNPLHILVLRVYRLSEVVKPSMKSNYTGCKSWVDIDEELEDRELVPVLSDIVFKQKFEDLRKALKLD